MAVANSDRLADAQAELETRVRLGRLHSADDLKADFPAVWDDPESRLELVYAEYVFRTANGEQPRREDWFGRYPDLHERLERLFGLYDLMAGDTHRPDATLGPERAPAKPPADAVHPDGYEILGELARGGMAVVYRARHQQLNRVVALKVLRWGDWDAADDARRVRREAELVARLQHPNIVQVYEVGEWDGDPFLALEYVAGGTLADALARYQRQGQTGVSTAEAAALVGVLAAAVQAAHEQGVVHRDLKPANVLLADDPAGPFARPKVTDFGLAVSTELSTAITQTATVAGTPCYMAPEQADARRAALGPRTDVYALGGILYELLTGRPPSQGATVLETLDLVRHAEPVSPRQLRPNLPRDLETVCLKCLSKDPTRRYDSAAALADDLARFRDGRPIAARPVGVVEKGWKWCRRRPVLAGLAAALVAAIALGVVGVTREYRRAESERATAVAAAEGEHKAKLDAEEKERLAVAATALTAERLKQIERINGSVFDIFAEFDIRKVKAGDKPVEAVLAEKLIDAGKKLDAKAIQDPLVLANLRNRLGVTLINLGEPNSAIELFDAAWIARKAEHGPDHRDTIESINNLASAYQAAGKMNEALPLFEESVSRMKTVYGPTHENTLTGINNLAMAYAQSFQFAKALTLLEETLEIAKKAHGRDHATSLALLNNLATVHKYSGRPDKALPLLEEALPLCKDKHGPDHLDTLRCQGNLAEAYRETRKPDKALPLYEDTLARMKATLGPNHPATLMSMANMALGYASAGNPGKALPLYEETLARRRVKLGADHADTLVSMNNLARAYLVAGKPDAARPLYEEARPLVKAAFPPEHPLSLAVLINLGKLYCDAKQGPKAAETLTEYFATRRKQGPPDDTRLAGELATLAPALQECGEIAAAEAMLRECVAIREKKQPDHWTTFNARSLLGSALLVQKKYADAEPLLLQGYEGMKAREKSIPQPGGSEAIPEALDRLIALYTSTKKPDEVKKYQDLRGGYPASRPKEKK